MSTAWIAPAAGVLLLGLVVWASVRMLRSPGARSGGARDAMGNFIDVFNPGQARAERDLRTQRNQGAVLPSPDDEDTAPGIDLGRNRARLPRPR